MPSVASEADGGCQQGSPACWGVNLGSVQRLKTMVDFRFRRKKKSEFDNSGRFLPYEADLFKKVMGR